MSSVRKLSRRGSGVLPSPSAQLAGEKLVERVTTKEGKMAQLGERAYDPRTGKHIQITLNRAILFSSPISETLTEPDSEEQLCLPEASPASLSLSPGSDEARKMTVRSGRKCLELSTSQDPLGLLEKMLVESSAWNSTKCYLTWKWKATPAGRSILELSPSTPHTEGCESGLLPTANQRDWKGARQGYRRGWGGDISDQIAMLPTPASVPDSMASHGQLNGPLREGRKK